MSTNRMSRPPFQSAALEYFRTQVPEGSLQALDGVAAFSDLNSYWFWRFRLDRMVRKGLLRRGKIRSYFPSYDGTPTYGLPLPQ